MPGKGNLLQARHAESGGRRCRGLRQLAELLRRAAELSETEDHDGRLQVMQAVHDHPSANDAERAEAAHHIAVSHAGKGDHETAASWHDYTRQLPGATGAHHEVGQAHSQRHGAQSETHENPLHENSSAAHIQAHLDHADQHLSGGNHGESIARHSAIANHPNASSSQQAHAISQVGHGHAAAGDHETAGQWHRAAAQHSGAQPHHVQAAQDHHETHGQGSHVHGESSADDLRRHVQTAETHVNNGELARALEMLLALLNHGNADADTQAHALHLTARVHDANGDHATAAQHHRAAAEHSGARSEHRGHYDQHRNDHPDHHDQHAGT
jgi:hypothetical protein